MRPSDVRCCPACGRRLPNPRPASVSAPMELAFLSDADLRAYYRSIMLREDVRFFIRSQGSTMSPDVRTRWERLYELAEATPAGTPALSREYAAAKAMHWQTRDGAERRQRSTQPTQADWSRWSTYVQIDRARVRTALGDVISWSDASQPAVIHLLPQAEARV